MLTFNALWTRLRSAALRTSERPRPDLQVARLGSLAEWQRRVPAELREQHLAEDRACVPPSGEAFALEGYCWPDAGWRRFQVDFRYGGTTDGTRWPNWRERLVCPRCGLNNRQRAALHVFEEVLQPARDARIYVTEQLSPVYAWLRARHPAAVGSEFLGDSVAAGASDRRGIRHEDVTQLSFADASFDFVLCFDVFEHVPDYRRAFAECARVLGAGGQLLFSVPFAADSEPNLVRATRAGDGTVTHLHPAEYHGDPVRPDRGVLCYQHFGWRTLDELRECGFRDAHALAFHSRDFGYMGGESLLFVAAK